jgi:hypothetical protein
MSKILDKIDNVLNEKKKTKFKKPSWKELKNRLKKLKKIKFKKPSKPKTAMTITSRIKKSAKKLFGSLFKKMRLVESSDEKISALASFLDVKPDTISDNGWAFESDDEVGEYIVLTDSEADDAVKEYIEESIWAFNTDFLLSQMTLEDVIKYYGFEDTYYDEDTEEDVEIGDDEEVFYMNAGMSLEEHIKEIQEKYEDGNQELLRLIDDIDDFVDDAVSSDGRGHFLSSYDGNENEEGKYYIYRTN